MTPFKILFCCMGNICRSPMAEGWFRHLSERNGWGDLIEVDSAGTHADRPGMAPDGLAQAVMRARGIDIGHHRARRIAPQDFGRFNRILAMDAYNLQCLKRVCPDHLHSRIGYLLDYLPDVTSREIPDPYGEGEEAFLHVLELVQMGSDGLFEAIKTGSWGASGRG